MCNQADIRNLRLGAPSSGAGAILAVLLLAGCASAPYKNSAYYAPTRPIADTTTKAPANGAIYQSTGGMTLFADPKASNVGDILTILLVENTDASKESSTKTDKSSDADIGGAHLFGAPVTYNGQNILDAGYKANRGFDGKGAISQSNSLDGSVTVTVAKRLSNGNLIVRGQKRVTLNQGEEYVRVAGVVRPADIRPDNTVLSTRVANARITYSSDGTLHNTTTKGWLAKFFSSPLMPF